jgi:APA family basic amino acid/polyamine antiporter
MTTGTLERKIGPGTATFIVVANMVGAGIFVTSGILAARLPGPGWILACWLLGGLIALSGALCYAELATRMPEVGGEYVYLKTIYHPVLGFLTGWTSFVVGFSVPIAASALAFSEYVFAGMSRASDASAAPPALAKKAVSLAVIALFTFIHYRGVKLGGRVQNALTSLKIVIIAGLALVGVLAVRSPFPTLSFAGAGTGTLLGFGTAMMMVMFAYSGWNASSYIAGEVRNPRRNLPLSLIAGTLIVTGLYLAVNVFIFRSLPFAEAGGVIPIVEKAAVRTFGPWMGNGLGLLVGFCLLSSLSAYIILGPRVYYSMAKDGLFFSFAGRVHPRFGVPGWSILCQGAFAAAMVVLGSFEQLLIYMGFALNIFPWLAVLGVFLERRKNGRPPAEAGAFRAWGYPATPVFYLVASLGLMAVNYINRPLESTAAVLTVLAGIPVYILWLGRKGAGR